MGPLALFALAGTVVAVGVAASSDSKPAAPSDSKPAAPSWATVTKLYRATPPAPFYAPNVTNARYPLVWWASDETRPVPGNIAMDVRGEAWAALPRRSGPATACMYGDVWDVDARNWVPCDTQETVWFYAHWGTSADWTDHLETVIKKYVVPAAITAVGAAVGGVGGAAAAFAIQTAWNVAMGAKFSDAVVDAYSDRLADVVNKTAYKQAFDTFTSMPMTRTAIAAVKEKTLAGKAPFERAALTDVLNNAIGLARTKQLQDALLVGVKSRITPEESAWLDASLTRGATLHDWVVAMFGAPGPNLMQWILDTATRELDAGRDPGPAVVPQRKLIPIAKSGLVTTAGHTTKRGSQLAHTRAA